VLNALEQREIRFGGAPARLVTDCSCCSPRKQQLKDTVMLCEGRGARRVSRLRRAPRCDYLHYARSPFENHSKAAPHQLERLQALSC